jgi:hypothetical protein
MIPPRLIFLELKMAKNLQIYPDGRLDTSGASSYLGLSVKTLAGYRSRGVGPVWTKIGRVFYFQNDLDAWIANGSANSTAQSRLKN